MNLAELVLRGDRRAIARSISLLENDGPEARQVLIQLYHHTGRAHIVGVTGAPGTGKSTLVNEITKCLRRRGLTVGIVAVDPTSPFSGGALLGDRIRMRDLAGDRGVFVRSMATRGSLGGLARATADAVKVLDAAGFDMVIIETVGTGQSEVDIARTAHTTIVIQVPGLGDDIQAIKAGILEIADVFAVNKADREGADSTVMALEMMLDLNHAVHNRPMDTAISLWRPPIHKTIALRGVGVEELVGSIQAHRNYLIETGLMKQRERERIVSELEHILEGELMTWLRDRTAADKLNALINRIIAREVDPYTVAATLLAEAGIGSG